MNISGIVLKVVADGYERLATLKTDKRELTFTYLDYDNFVDGCNIINDGVAQAIVKAELKLVMATIDCATPFQQSAIEQPIEGSPHTLISGVIRELEGDELIVAIDGFGSLEVELESEVTLSVGHEVSFKGELNSENNLS
jgi:hypothetical protein